MPLCDINRLELRNKYSEVKIVIIDEILIVSGKLLYQIHKRLNEIFSLLQDIQFGWNLELVYGKFYQLHSVQGKTVFMFNEPDKYEGFLVLDL